MITQHAKAAPHPPQPPPLDGDSKGATAAPAIKLQVALLPDRPGASTTIAFSFTISTAAGQSTPPPLSSVELLYPRNLGIATSELGLDTCTTTTLELQGPEGCPADSQIGHGSALVEISFGPQTVQEAGTITAYMSPPQDGHLGLTFYAEGSTPVVAELAFPGLVLPAPAQYGGKIVLQIPPIPGVSEGPDASVTHLQATIGPLGLTYYEHRHGHTIPYHPKGIILPRQCPRDGFPFAATFSFADHTNTTTRVTVPCHPRAPTQKEHTNV